MIKKSAFQIFIASFLLFVAVANLVTENRGGGRNPAQIQQSPSINDQLTELMDEVENKFESEMDPDLEWSDKEVRQKINEVLEMAPPASWRSLQVLKIDKVNDIYIAETPSDLCSIRFPSKIEDRNLRYSNEVSINEAVNSGSSIAIAPDPWQSRKVTCYPKKHILASRTREEVEAAIKTISGESETIYFDPTLQVIAIGEKPESIFDDPNVGMTTMNRQERIDREEQKKMELSEQRRGQRNGLPTSYDYYRDGPMPGIGGMNGMYPGQGIMGGGMGTVEVPGRGSIQSTTPPSNRGTR